MCKHAPLSPSAAERWLNCTASYEFCKDIKSETSTYAKEGQDAHALAGWYLELGKIMSQPSLLEQDTWLNQHWAEKPTFSEFYSKEMEKYIQQYIDYIDNIKAYEPYKYYIEYKVQIPIIRGFGTVDFWSIKDNILHIADLKYGKGKRVNVKDNQQLKLYAWGVLQKIKNLEAIHKIALHIIQPRINKDGVFESWTIGITSLTEWAKYYVKVKADFCFSGIEGGAKFKTGSWCWFCPGKDLCKHKKSEEIRRDFDDQFR